MPGPQPNNRANINGPRPLLRRVDQAAVASLVAFALVGMAVYWFVHGGHRGELIEIDRAEPLTARLSGRHQQGRLAGAGRAAGHRRNARPPHCRVARGGRADSATTTICSASAASARERWKKCSHICCQCRIKRMWQAKSSGNQGRK